MRPLLLALPLALALTGCSADDADPVAQATTSQAPSATVAPTIEAPSPTPVATTASPSASPSAVPVKAAVDGDVDGDGKPDAVKATVDLLTVTLSRTGKKVTAPVHADSPAPPEVLGSTDVDRDGRAEVFVKTVQGASTGFATPYRFDGTALRELQLDGAPALLGFGGSTQHGDGFRCTPSGLIEVRKAEAEGSGATYRVELNAYRLTAANLVRVRTSVTTAKQGSREVEASYTVDCGSVGEGG